MSRTTDWIIAEEERRRERQESLPDRMDDALDHLEDIAATLSNVLTKFDPVDKNRIFLSHKNCDKPLVRRFMSALRSIGFDPWLDEEAMPAGSHLDHSILLGLKESCAAVFFITPSFRYDGFLKQEVEYAIAEERERSERFSIITLLLDGSKEAQIPSLLKRFVWKVPANDLDAFVEIIRSLPVRTGPPIWRSS